MKKELTILYISITALSVLWFGIVYAQTATIDTKDNVIVIQPAPIQPNNITYTLDQCNAKITQLTNQLNNIQAQINFWNQTCTNAANAGIQSTAALQAQPSQVQVGP